MKELSALCSEYATQLFLKQLKVAQEIDYEHTSDRSKVVVLTVAVM